MKEDHQQRLIAILEQLLSRAKSGTYHGKGYAVKMQLAMDLVSKLQGKDPETNAPLTIAQLCESNLDDLTESERSRLVYLLDALRTSPHQYQKLIAIVKQENTSVSYQSILISLESSKDIVEDQKILRERLR